jgi:hypothetical protein
MAGSLDDRVALVLTPGDYKFVVIGADVAEQSRIYRQPYISPKDVANELRRMADVLDAVLQ